jgi:hypothetical protein
MDDLNSIILKVKKILENYIDKNISAHTWADVQDIICANSLPPRESIVVKRCIEALEHEDPIFGLIIRGYYQKNNNYIIYNEIINASIIKDVIEKLIYKYCSTY